MLVRKIKNNMNQIDVLEVHVWVGNSRNSNIIQKFINFSSFIIPLCTFVIAQAVTDHYACLLQCGTVGKIFTLRKSLDKIPQHWKGKNSELGLHEA